METPERYAFDYATTCDALPGRHDDNACLSRPLGWRELTAEICAGRPVIASLRSPAAARGHMVVVKGFSTRPQPRVLVVDPARVCPSGRDCEGELDEAFWLSYDEYAAGWGGMVHWVDFYGIRMRAAVTAPRSSSPVGPSSPRRRARGLVEKESSPTRHGRDAATSRSIPVGR